MKLGLGLHLKLSQTLAPQLIQSLKMLQMPVLKLEQTIRHELATNPLLEEIEELEADEKDDDADSEVEIEDKEGETVEWEEYLFDDDDGYKVREQRESPEERFEGMISDSITLFKHLSDQLSLLKLSTEERLMGEYVIGNISPEGYLTISVPEMAAELQVEEEDIESLTEMIRRFDPVGVGSRDLKESLQTQLREKGEDGSLAYRIVSEHIQDLDRKSMLQIAKFMGVPVERAQQAMLQIKSLNPTPAQGRFDSAAIPVVPDLIIDRFGDEFVVFHNDSRVPRLRINANYKNLIRRGNKTSSQDTKQYVRQKLEQARWLLNSINQRRSTMIRVMESIIERQIEFFENGPAFLKPLIMEDIAQMVDMNVATISRVSNGKYVQTPLGVYEIKYFFNSGISRAGGEDVAKRTVKQRLDEIIKAEDPEKPLSDQEIFRRLNAEGIKLARRTVTKYREELKLPPARLRKRIV